MTVKPTTTTEARDLRALLDTVLDALTLPYNTPDYDQRILYRAALARILAGAALAESTTNLGWSTDYLRGKLTAEQTEADKRTERGEGQ